MASLRAESDVRTLATPYAVMAWRQGLVLLLANVAAALALRRRRQLRLCKAAATLPCLGFPPGTALGGWTLLVLQRPASAALLQDPRR
ncbi:hypothetical protein ACFOPN_17100 [Xanthomonas hyacinthi]